MLCFLPIKETALPEKQQNKPQAVLRANLHEGFYRVFWYKAEKIMDNGLIGSQCVMVKFLFRDFGHQLLTHNLL